MLSVSDIKQNRPVWTWLMITLFCAVFAMVYEYFSFGVYSYHMIFLFAWPLFLGALPCFLLKRDIGRLWNDGVLLTTAGSLLAGIFEIYGTASTLTIWFWAAGGLLLVMAAVFELTGKHRELHTQ
ncbi:MAG: hypothetical protein IKG46_08970 [Solobacterium sp.]|nr:hypothetical protein [Solobacterium sp.]